MEWNKDLENKAPKTGEIILRYNKLQNTYRLISWKSVHKHWCEGGQWVPINETDIWMRIPNHNALHESKDDNNVKEDLA